MATLLGAVASFLIPTIHEVAALGWFFCTLLMLSFIFFQKKEWLRMKIFLMITALSAGPGLAVLLLSPGVAARSLAQDYPPPPPLPEILSISFHSFIYFIRNLTLPYYAYQQGRQPVWLIAVSLSGLGWFTPVSWTRRWRIMLIILFTAVIMAYLSFVPGAYATSGSIPLRSQLIPVAYLSIGVFCAALFIPRWSDDRRSSIFISLVLACLILGSCISIGQFSRTIQPMRQYARDWDVRHSAAQLNPGAIARIQVPWEESEQEFNCVRDYYLSLYPDSD